MQGFITWLLIAAVLAPALCLVWLQGNNPKQALSWHFCPVFILTIALYYSCNDRVGDSQTG